MFSGVRLRSTRFDAPARTPSLLTFSTSAASILNSFGANDHAPGPIVFSLAALMWAGLVAWNLPSRYATIS